MDARELLAGPPDDDLDVALGHGLMDLPVDDGAGVAVEQAAQGTACRIFAVRFLWQPKSQD